MGTNRSLDKLIKEAVQLNTEDGLSKEINLDQEWFKFRRTYFYEEKKPSFKMKFLFAYSIVTIIIIISVITIFPNQARALSEKTLSFFRAILSGKVETVSINYKRTENYNTMVQSLLEPNMLEQINRLPFKIFLPLEYLHTFQLDSLSIEELGDSKELTYNIYLENNKIVQIVQANITQGFSQGVSYDNEDASKIVVIINGQEAILIEYKKKYILLTWIEKDIAITMQGNVSKDEMLQLATSMRQIP